MTTPARRRLASSTFADRTLQVLHRPGHSPSDTLFHDRERRELIGGDHLIGHISSNPLISRPLGGKSGEPGGGRPRALITYMRSMRETREMDRVSVILPGHGDPVTDHVKLIDERFALHERRARKIGGLIEERPRSAYEIAQSLWGNVAVTQAYLTLCEVLGHVDLLLDEGSVVEQEARADRALPRRGLAHVRGARMRQRRLRGVGPVSTADLRCEMRLERRSRSRGRDRRMRTSPPSRR